MSMFWMIFLPSGSGKTLAFSVPGLAHLTHRLKVEGKKGRKGPMMLIVAPTRELAMQSQEVGHHN